MLIQTIIVLVLRGAKLVAKHLATSGSGHDRCEYSWISAWVKLLE